MAINEYLEANKRSKKILDTIVADHYRALSEAAEILRGGDGLIDYDLLEEEAYQDKFVDSLNEFYMNGAKNILQSQSSDPLIQALLGKAVYGVNRDILSKVTGEHKSGLFREGGYVNLIPELTKDVQRTLRGEAVSNIKEADIDDILERTQIKEVVDRDKVDVRAAIRFLDNYERLGVVPPKWMKEYLREREAAEEAGL